MTETMTLSERVALLQSANGGEFERQPMDDGNIVVLALEAQ